MSQAVANVIFVRFPFIEGGPIMTLAIAIATADGLVVAGDSRTSLMPSGQPARVLSDFTHKVYQAGRCAVATYGFGFLLGRNVAGHMAEFVAGLDGEPGPEEVAELLADYFADLLERHFNEDNDPRPDGDAIGFLIGGYADSKKALILDVCLPSRSIEPVTNDGTGGGWRGQTDVLMRVIKGVDLGLLIQLVDPSEQEEMVAKLLPVVPQMEYIVPFAFMNLQDAIDFAVFAIRTTIDIQRLSYGTPGMPGSFPGVGGPIEIAAVTPTSGFVWVQQTALQGERPAGIAEMI